MKAWIKRKNEPDEVVRVIPDEENMVRCYQLFTAFENDHLGRMLFDAQGYWIYDGDELTIDEQEQLAKFIQRDQQKEIIWNS